MIRTQARVEKVYKEIEKAGCVASAVIAERLRIGHNELFYVLRKLRQEGRVESVNFGRVALWCTSRAAAEEVLSRLAEALKSLLCGRSRFATPKKALQLVTKDPELCQPVVEAFPICPYTAAGAAALVAALALKRRRK